MNINITKHFICLMLLDVSRVVLMTHQVNGSCNAPLQVDYVADPPAVKVVERFRGRLQEVSDTIKERNTWRDPPYAAMDPDNIRNSISA